VYTYTLHGNMQIYLPMNTEHIPMLVHTYGVYVCVHVCACVYRCVCACASACVTCMYLFVYLGACVSVCMCITHEVHYTNMHSQLKIQIRDPVHACAHIRTLHTPHTTHTHTHAHVHSHTYTKSVANCVSRARFAYKTARNQRYVVCNDFVNL